MGTSSVTVRTCATPWWGLQVTVILLSPLALIEAAEELDRIDAAKDAVYWTDEGYEFIDYWLNERADRIEREV